MHRTAPCPTTHIYFHLFVCAHMSIDMHMHQFLFHFLALVSLFALASGVPPSSSTLRRRASTTSMAYGNMLPTQHARAQSRALHTDAPNANTLPLCAMYNDTYGSWIPNPLTYTIDKEGIDEWGMIGGSNSINSTNVDVLKDLKTHFVGNEGPGDALKFPFNQVWKPEGCAMHRFTNQSAHHCLHHQLKKDYHLNNKTLHVLFIGDSATRGVYCGILRILSGSEQFGSCESIVCGNSVKSHAVSYTEMGQEFEKYLMDGHLRLTFIYEKSWISYGWKMHLALIDYLNAHTVDYVILNTGVWDYDDIARRHIGVDAPRFCWKAGPGGWDHEIAVKRAFGKIDDDPKGEYGNVNDTLHRIKRLADTKGTKLIYRTNHHNSRYGPMCADFLVLPLYEAAGWEVWDNMRVSEAVWHEQTWDGFHFERIYHCHPFRSKTLAYNNTWYSIYGYWMEWPHAGILEAQFAQSLLNRLFYPCLNDLYGRGTGSNQLIAKAEEGVGVGML